MAMRSGSANSILILDHDMTLIDNLKMNALFVRQNRCFVGLCYSMDFSRSSDESRGHFKPPTTDAASPYTNFSVFRQITTTTPPTRKNLLTYTLYANTPIVESAKIL